MEQQRILSLLALGDDGAPVVRMWKVPDSVDVAELADELDLEEIDTGPVPTMPGLTPATPQQARPIERTRPL